MSANMTLQQAVVDGDFRDELVRDPEAFGVSSEALAQLVSVAAPDQDLFDFWAEGVTATELYACATTCSSGPLTIVCDGSTK